MFNFFDVLVQYVEQLFRVISNLFSSLAMLVDGVLNALLIPQSLFTSCFSFLGASLMVVYVFGVIKLLVGR